MTKSMYCEAGTLLVFFCPSIQKYSHLSSELKKKEWGEEEEAASDEKREGGSRKEITLALGSSILFLFPSLPISSSVGVWCGCIEKCITLILQTCWGIRVGCKSPRWIRKRC